MTYAAVPALRVDDALAKEWTPRLASRSYDPGVRSHTTKAGALAGMGMTEKQGGSDVRANQTRATPTTDDGWYRLDVVRLKDKLGNRSNASSELEFRGTWAQRLGDEGRGVRTIIEMVAATRLDCVLGSASLMRRALAAVSYTHLTLPTICSV